jgi:hypothetical protein
MLSASNMFLVFSWVAIIASMSWALGQLLSNPSKNLRVSVTALIAAISALALYNDNGLLLRDQQSQELAQLRSKILAQSQRIPCGGGNTIPLQVKTEADTERKARC